MLHLARPGLIIGWCAASFAATTGAHTPAPPLALTAQAAQTSQASTMAPAEAEPASSLEEKPFSRAEVVAKARTLAQTPYKEPESMAPESAAALNYDQYHRIEFKRGAADWAQAPEKRFRIHYDPQGYLFDAPIKVNLVRAGDAEPRPFRAGDFNFFDLPLSPEDIEALQFAGFHLTTPLNEGGKFDDVINFRGASFFRVLAAGTDYGASARGLAVKTASQTGEEFPAFREFWIEDPGAGDALVIHALLDSPSVSGAYTFTVTPGAQTIVDVKATLFPRTEIDNVGVAPVTSMFDLAPHDPHPERRDVRPRVHDSEGLLVRLRSGEWAWRPLINPKKLEISVFAEKTPYGFGLMQRERDPAAYQDLEARYQRRPSVWIEPEGDWGAGKLTLIEIPTENEFNDNIVLYWRPDKVWKAGEEIDLAYRMVWGRAPKISTAASVVQSRVGRSLQSGRPFFVIDYDVAGIGGLDGIEPSVSAGNGAVREVHLMRNPITGGARLTFELDPEGAPYSELRANLLRAGEPVSETWLYRASAP